MTPLVLVGGLALAQTASPFFPDPVVAARVKKLLAHLDDTEANGQKQAQTSLAISELVTIGPRAVPPLLEVIIDTAVPFTPFSNTVRYHYCLRTLNEMGRTALPTVQVIWAGWRPRDRWKLMDYLSRYA